MAKQQRWAAFKQKTIKFILPSSGIEVTLKEPDVLSAVLLNGNTLPESFFNMFASATKEGDGLEVMEKLSQDAEAGEGMKIFLNLVAREAFLEPRLVDNADEADYEKTVPIDAITLTDKMAVMSNFEGMMAQLSSVNTFRSKPNGDVADASESDELQSIAEPDSGD